MFLSILFYKLLFLFLIKYMDTCQFFRGAEVDFCQNFLCNLDGDTI